MTHPTTQCIRVLSRLDRSGQVSLKLKCLLTSGVGLKDPRINVLIFGVFKIPQRVG